MPSRVTYMNQSAPFWDFIASMEQQGANHPFFSQNRDGENQHEQDQGDQGHQPPPPFGRRGWGQFMGGRGMPHRGPPPSGPPPSGPPPYEHGESAGEKDGEKNDEQNKKNDNGEGPSDKSGSDNEGCPHIRGRHGRCGGGRRGRHEFGGRGGFGHHGGPHHGGPHHHPGPYHDSSRQGPQHYESSHHGPHRYGGRGSRGPWGHGGPFGGGFDPSALAAHFWDQFVNPNIPSNTNTTTNPNTNTTTPDSDFSPEADVFDTESSFVIHVSLPGAKKEDVGVNWDVEKSELSIAGVIYRPGNEEFLKTLAMNERKVGPFERKVRLGTRANPAQIDVEGITAKLEDGVLRVEVPKLGETGFVEVRKVDIE